MPTYKDFLRSNAVAVAWNESIYAKQEDYLGRQLFGTAKQLSLSLSWLKGAGGLPITLAPSSFDGEVRFRDRIGFEKMDTEMPLFREGYEIREVDRRALMEADALGDTYLKDVLHRVYDDTNNLIRGANVVPERMIMQLLGAKDGTPAIAISANGVDYAYNYDPNGNWKANNYIDVSSTPWTTPASSTPIADLTAAVKKAKLRGVAPRYAVMSQATFNNMADSAEVKSAVLAQNVTATIFMTEKLAKDVVEALTGVRPVIYNMFYADENKASKAFFPDNYVAIIPEGQLGTVFYSTTNEEYDLIKNTGVDVTVVNTGVAITSITPAALPVKHQVYASEIVLPSFERIDEVFGIKVGA